MSEEKRDLEGLSKAELLDEIRNLISKKSYEETNALLKLFQDVPDGFQKLMLKLIHEEIGEAEAEYLRLVDTQEGTSQDMIRQIGSATARLIGSRRIAQMFIDESEVVEI